MLATSIQVIDEEIVTTVTPEEEEDEENVVKTADYNLNTVDGLRSTITFEERKTCCPCHNFCLIANVSVPINIPSC